MTVVRAAESLGLSERNVYRLLARYRREGAAALAPETADALPRQPQGPPPQPEFAYRSWPPERDPETWFCLKNPRTVANDNTIALNGHRLQITADPYRGNYACCQVEVRQHLDGRLSIGY